MNNAYIKESMPFKVIVVLVACMMACTVVAQAAWAAMTGYGWDNQKFVMWSSVEDEWGENVLTVDGEWVYCAEYGPKFAEGREVWAQDPVETGLWSQELVNELALAEDYVFSGRFRIADEFGGGYVSNDIDKYAVTQMLVWEILNRAHGGGDFDWVDASVEGRQFFGEGDGHGDFWSYIDARKGFVTGSATYYDAGAQDQDVVGNFELSVPHGGVKVGKVDQQNGTYVAQGGATLEQAEFTIYSLNDFPVDVNGISHANGEPVATIQTHMVDGRAVASTPSNLLPAGRYEIVETSACPGYTIGEESTQYRRTFVITQNDQVIDLTSEDDAAHNRVIRGDFAFDKVDASTGARLRRIPFLVTSQTTDEAHVIVTDDNGRVSTAAEWSAHTLNTNANDKAVALAEGKYLVDDRLLDPSAGVWFAGSQAVSCAADDGLGALPYDQYTVTELRCEANKGYELVSFTVGISKDGVILDQGEVADNPGPALSTTLSDGEGEHAVAPAAEVTLVDAVRYANLEPEAEYTLRGSLRLASEDGSESTEVATMQVAFRPMTSDGLVNVPFTIDASELKDARLVAFEYLMDASGEEVASHEDLDDEGQTVRVREDIAPAEERKTENAGTSMPRTGDALVAVPFMAIAAVAAGALLAAVAIAAVKRTDKAGSGNDR